MDCSRLNTEILSRIGTLQGTISFQAICPETGEVISHNEHTPLVPASVIKLGVMAEAYRQKEAGLIDFDTPVTIHRENKLPSCGALTYLHDELTVHVSDLVTLMIIVSDNTATNLLIEMLGKENINAFMREIGMTDSELQRPLFRPDLAKLGLQNRMTAADVNILLRRILEGTLVSAEASASMLQHLKDQRLNGKLPFLLHSRGIKVAHKTGEDDGTTHDAGIIFSDPLWIVTFMSNGTDVPQTERAMQDIAAMLAGIPV